MSQESYDRGESYAVDLDPQCMWHTRDGWCCNAGFQHTGSHRNDLVETDQDDWLPPEQETVQ